MFYCNCCELILKGHLRGNIANGKTYMLKKLRRVRSGMSFGRIREHSKRFYGNLQHESSLFTLWVCLTVETFLDLLFSVNEL